jgi:hypothetical protein
MPIGFIGIPRARKNAKAAAKLWFEVSDGKIIQSTDDSPSIEIALTNIESLIEYRGWLLIRGAEARRQISIPGNRRIRGAETRTDFVSSCYCRQCKGLSVFVSAFVLMIIAWLLLLTSYARAVVLCAGIAVLGLQGAGTYSLLRTLRGTTKLKFIVLTLALTWLLIGFIVFLRLKSAF